MFSPAATMRRKMISAFISFLEDEAITFWTNGELSADIDYGVPFTSRSISIGYISFEDHPIIEDSTPYGLLTAFLDSRDARKLGIDAAVIAYSSEDVTAELRVYMNDGRFAVLGLSMLKADSVPDYAEFAEYHYRTSPLALLRYYFDAVRETNYTASNLFIFLYLCEELNSEKPDAEIAKLVSKLYEELKSCPVPELLSLVSEDIVSFVESSVYWAEAKARFLTREIFSEDMLEYYLQELTKRVLTLAFELIGVFTNVEVDLDADFKLESMPEGYLYDIWYDWAFEAGGSIARI